jgi:hypothetical protein
MYEIARIYTLNSVLKSSRVAESCGMSLQRFGNYIHLHHQGFTKRVDAAVTL